MGPEPSPYVFPHAEEIAKSWGLGGVKITAPRLSVRVNKIIGYIGKYIGKGYEYEALNFKKSFTASQIKQIYKLAPQRLAAVIKRFGKKAAEGFSCTYTKVFLLGYDINVIMGMELLKPFKGLIMQFRSEWNYEGIYAEPF